MQKESEIKMKMRHEPNLNIIIFYHVFILHKPKREKDDIDYTQNKYRKKINPKRK